jgi:DNA polymerase-1
LLFCFFPLFPHAGHAERVAINTPIQGGAADVVMAGMLKLHAHEQFRELGWRVLLQIHDELICEGPEESSEEAMVIVWDCMSRPFKNPLLVDLVVDGSAAHTWFEAK